MALLALTGVMGAAQATASEIKSKGGDAFAVAMNVTDEAQVARAFERVMDAFGGLDMVVLNAGVFPGGRRIAELSAEEWRRVMRVNVDANQWLLRECHPYLRIAPRGGRVGRGTPAPKPPRDAGSDPNPE